MNIDNEMKIIIDNLIENSEVDTFFTGGMGQTDDKFSSIVRSLKKTYPHIRLVLIKPYFSNELNTNKYYYSYTYDDIVIPEELAGCHFKSAITKRNKWMIDHSDFVIDCTYRDFGGAVDAITYAHRCNKTIFKIKK